MDSSFYQDCGGNIRGSLLAQIRAGSYLTYLKCYGSQPLSNLYWTWGKFAHFIMQWDGYPSNDGSLTPFHNLCFLVIKNKILLNIPGTSLKVRRSKLINCECLLRSVEIYESDVGESCGGDGCKSDLRNCGRRLI